MLEFAWYRAALSTTPAFQHDTHPLEPRTGVLCLHGFTGTTFDVETLAAHLTREGHAVSAPLLPGHGRDVAALAHTTADAWLDAAHAELRALCARTGRRVAIAGTSMGALLALRLARTHADDVAALVLMATPLRLRPLERHGIAALSRLADALGVPGPAIPKAGGVDAADPAVRAAAPSTPAYPLSALSELLALSDRAATDLPHITTPALVVHGRLDRTVPIAVSEDVARTLGGPVERLWLDRSGHLVAADHDRAAVAAAVSGFLSRQARWTRAQARA